MRYLDHRSFAGLFRYFRPLQEHFIRRPIALVGRIGDAIPLIETLIGRIATLCLAEVPLAEMGGGITHIAQHLSHGVFPLGQAIIHGLERYRTVPRAYGITACH